MQVLLKDVSLHLPTANKLNTPNKSNGIKKGGLNFASRFRRNKFIALDKISLSLKEGERVAVIGSNGAGKSTLLRLLAGIYVPTSGQASIPEYALPLLDKSIITDGVLTAITACKAHYFYIKARYGKLSDEIKNVNDFTERVLDFAELNDVRQTPIMHYSDGMRARLSFSLYTFFEHPFIVIDEAFGTVDKKFTQKSSERFDKFVNNSSILLLASHSDKLLEKYCNKAILIKNGQLKIKGELSEVLEAYKKN